VMQDMSASLNEAELSRAVRQLEVSLRMGMDSVESNMLHLGNRFDEAHILPQDAWMKQIRSVTLDEARAWAAKKLAGPALWTCSGPLSALNTLPKDLQV